MPEPEARAVKIPELCRVSLFNLFVKAKDAQAAYDLAASHALAALGFDPRVENHIDLDTGEVTPPTLPDAPKE